MSLCLVGRVSTPFIFRVLLLFVLVTPMQTAHAVPPIICQYVFALVSPIMPSRVPGAGLVRALVDRLFPTSKNQFSIARRQFRAVHGRIPEFRGWRGRKVFQSLLTPEKLYTLHIPFWRDVGKMASVDAYRSQHNSALGPHKGGTRSHHEVTRDESIALSMWMTVKTGIAGVPYGGGKGGIALVKGEKYSSAELERIYRGYIIELFGKSTDPIGPMIDIPAPDVGTNQHVMNMMLDQIIRIQLERGRIFDKKLQARLQNYMEKVKPYRNGDHGAYGGTPLVKEYMRLINSKRKFNPRELAYITGKPVELGGADGRTEATGAGVYFTYEELALRMDWFRPTKKGKPLSGLTTAIQGWGNVGAITGNYVHNKGGGDLQVIVTYVGGEKGKDFVIIKSSSRIDVNHLNEYAEARRKNTGNFAVKGYEKIAGEGENGEDITITYTNEKEALEAFVSAEVDVLIPAALANQITIANAHLVKAKYIIEGANGPTTPLADKILQKNNVLVVPDVVANAGGVIGSYYEWKQNMDNKTWTRTAYLHKLKQQMKENFARVYSLYESAQSEKNPLDFRQAAYVDGVGRVARAERARLYPKESIPIAKVADQGNQVTNQNGDKDDN